jgi:expansin (peptidoglycan-binding protein)
MDGVNISNQCPRDGNNSNSTFSGFGTGSGSGAGERSDILGPTIPESFMIALRSPQVLGGAIGVVSAAAYLKLKPKTMAWLLGGHILGHTAVTYSGR